MLNETKRILTCGYGNDKPDKFLERLKAAGVELVIDVRYYKNARLGCYRATGYDDRGMAAFLAGKPEEPIADIIEYIWCPELGKPKEMPLGDYVHNVLETNEGEKFLWLANWHIRRRANICLLCAERDAYKDDEVNCHRVYVADALVELLGDGWTVEHI